MPITACCQCFTYVVHEVCPECKKPTFYIYDIDLEKTHHDDNSNTSTRDDECGIEASLD